MTVIAAAITKGDGVVIVGDSEVTHDFTKDNDGFSKLWVSEEHSFIFGGCGSIRAMQIVRYWTDWPYYRSNTDPEEFVIKEVVPRIRESLSLHGALLVSKKTESFDGALIMAWDNNLVVIDEDFGVTVPVSGRYAIGSGQSEALGSLGNKGPWIKSEVIEAAKRSAVTALGVGGPLWTVTTRTHRVEKI